MKRAFRDAYNRELALLKEQAREFSVEYPGLADRLGGLIDGNLDPSVAGLLEGSAFLAARVQLKMDEQYRVFTHELLNQVFPDALAPTPSVMLVKARVPLEHPYLESGLKFEPGQYLDARYTLSDKRVSCRFSLTAPLQYWPFTLTKAAYYDSAGPISALGQEIASGTKAGLRMELTRIQATGSVEGEAAVNDFTGDDLTVYLSAAMDEAALLYEQMFCDLTRVSLRWLDAQGDPVFVHLPSDSLEQVGFEADEWLFPHNKRLFDGFARLREYFAFARKFLGFRLKGLQKYLSRIQDAKFEVIFEFNTASQKLAARIEPDHLALNAAPAVNLFEDVSSPVRIDRKQHEFVVMPGSNKITNCELQSITDVWAYRSGEQTKIKVLPLYALPSERSEPREALYFTSRSKPRRLSLQERRAGASRYQYRGTETFVSIYEPPKAPPVQRLQVKALCSNRHLPAHLPIAHGEDDFYFTDDQTVTLTCMAGPTPPRSSLADLEKGAAHRTRAGETYWRLISYLSLSHFGLESRDGKDAAAAMREMLSLFADLSDNVAEAHVSGLRLVETRPVARTIVRPDGHHVARGLEVKLTFDEEEFESSGVILIGAVLDRFLAEYASVNSFTQTVICSLQRGVIKTWPARIGSGAIL